MATSSISNYNGTSAYNLKPNGIDTRKMNGSYTPNAVPLNSLELYYDPANPDCYSGTGTTLFDVTGNNNGVIGGGMESSYVQNGWFNSDGVNDNISASNTTSIGYTTNGMGIWGWFRWDGTNATQGISNAYFNNAGPADRYGVRFYQFNNNFTMASLVLSAHYQNVNAYVSANVWTFFFNQLDYVSGTTFRLNKWMGTSTLTKVYENNSFTSNLPLTSAQNITYNIGVNANSFNGDLGECGFYNNTYLSDAQVTRIYNNTKARYGY